MDSDAEDNDEYDADMDMINYIRSIQHIPLVPRTTINNLSGQEVYDNTFERFLADSCIGVSEESYSLALRTFVLLKNSGFGDRSKAMTIKKLRVFQELARNEYVDCLQVASLGCVHSAMYGKWTSSLQNNVPREGPITRQRLRVYEEYRTNEQLN